MNQPINPNEPQQPITWGTGQQPQQPGPYAQQPPTAPPAPPKKTGRNVALGCGGAIVAGMLLMGGCAALIGGTSDSNTTPPAAADTSPAADDKAADSDKAKADKPSKSPEKTKKPATDKVTIKVWGDAPAGALGPMDITYGSDTENLEGKGLPFEKTLKLNDDAAYYYVMAQLQGSGDIHCSVTVNGKTEKAHAKGGHNICHAQANSTLFGW